LSWILLGTSPAQADDDSQPAVRWLLELHPARVEHGRSTSAGEPVEIRKRTAAPAELRADIAKLAANVTSFGVNAKVDETMALLAKRDPASTAKAGAILHSSPEVYDAYMARERWQAPVAKAAAPDASGHGVTIKKLIETNNMDGLGRLMRSDPAAHATYERMIQAGLTSAYSEVAKRQKARDPSDVSEAEKAGWKKKIKAWLADLDTPGARKALAAARESRDPAFQAAWIDLVAAGEIKTAA
jgi:hypothetical protein